MVKWILGGAAAVFALLVAWIVVHAIDVPLSEDAVTLRRPVVESMPPEQNLFYALVGFGAPSGESISEAGIELIAEDADLAERWLDRPELTENEYEPRKPAPDLQLRALCNPARAPCWPNIAKKAADIDRAASAFGELVDRYLWLHAYPVFVDTSPAWVPIAGHNQRSFASELLQVRGLFLAQTALQIRRGNTAARKAAFERLHADVRMWRLVLQGPAGPLSRLHALVSLHGDLMLLGEMLSDISTDLGAHADAIAAILDTLPPGEWVAGPFNAYEFASFEAVYDGIGARYEEHARFNAKGDMPLAVRMAAWKVMALAMPKGATTNMDAAYNMTQQKLCSLPAESYLAERDRLDKAWEKERGKTWAYLYNPIGRRLVLVFDKQSHEYCDYAHDLAAVQRMVRLVLEIRKAGLLPGAVQAFIDRYHEWSSHPATLEFFGWDPKERTISVKPLSRREPPPRYSLTLALY